MKSIVKLMEEKGIEDLNFLFHRNKPTVQKDGIRYEILSIYSEDGILILDGVKVYPGYEHKLVPLVVDNTWRKTSINHIKDIVNQEIKRIYEEN